MISAQVSENWSKSQVNKPEKNDVKTMHATLVFNEDIQDEKMLKITKC